MIYEGRKIIATTPVQNIKAEELKVRFQTPWSQGLALKGQLKFR